VDGATGQLVAPFWFEVLVTTCRSCAKKLLVKTATVTDLRRNFGRISKWLLKGETVRILKRRMPFARIVPESRGPSWLGSMDGTGNLPDDLDDPVPVRWKAADSNDRSID
jgi:antitoxin (DNA-binding transcriptional repressor) of toxin-antitoxin stability system